MKRVDLFYSTYSNFNEQLYADIRRETYGEDFGQTSWLTADEYERFYGWLELARGDHVLEVASGSGGPALYLARQYGCRLTGIDINENGVETSSQAALAAGLEGVDFQLADMNERLPFAAETFEAVMCMDSMNHFPDRPAVLREWNRLLKAGRRIVFTDPVVITGPVSNQELAERSNIGFFLFVPLETTERFIQEAGFRLIRREDVTANIELVSERWRAARQRRREELLAIEGQERFEGLQRFFAAVHHLTRERRLSRFVFLAEK